MLFYKFLIIHKIAIGASIFNNKTSGRGFSLKIAKIVFNTNEPFINRPGNLKIGNGISHTWYTYMIPYDLFLLIYHLCTECESSNHE